MRVGVVVAGTLVVLTAAWAKPPGPALFCQKYPAAPQCAGQRASCLTCHAQPPELNAYGRDLEPRVTDDYAATLGDALGAVEGLDSDGDGVKNLIEILAGTAPGDALSVPHQTANIVGWNSQYAVGLWDPVFAFKRVASAFCGKSPTYAEVVALKSAADPRAAVHAKLDACLRSAHWRDEALPRLADPRIRPLGAGGTCLNMFGNFEPDYALFAYAMTDGHDARDLLRAQYHVQRNADGSYSKVDESVSPMAAPKTRAEIVCRDQYGYSPPKIGGQPLAVDKRAGLMTTQWFLWRNTMGALVPRGSAALAYKSWLGFDISLHQGLYPVPSEPRDIDARGVSKMPCSNCHSTLDPLAYAFAPYWGGVGAERAELTGSYMINRYQYLVKSTDQLQAWTLNPPRPFVFGESLPLAREAQGSSALVEMSRRMADSEQFAKNLASILFVHAVGHEPDDTELTEFTALWKQLPGFNYSVDQLLHALIDTKAFGAP